MTRDQHRVALAWGLLFGGYGRFRDIGPWLERRDMPPAIAELTPAQARLARRELNAWRAADDGYVATLSRYPRKERRNATRRARREREAFALKGT